MSDLNQLPPDLIEAILSRLPVKSLDRFKSVSKAWYSLISSFIKTHILNLIINNPNPNPTHLILVPYKYSGNIIVPASDYSEYIYSLDIEQLNTQTLPATSTAKCLNFRKEWVEIRGSCNGNVLSNDIHDNLYLVNPTTQESLKVQDSGGESIGKTTYGFGYDSSKDDYKVIKISYKAISNSDLNSTLVHVYSLRNNSWNRLPNFPYRLLEHYNLRPGVGVLLNNNLHWLVGSRHSKLVIAAFSFADEEFHDIELPDPVNNDITEYSQLYVFGGKLYVLVYYWLNHDSFSYVLWVMEEYGVHKSWKKLCKINTDINLNGDEFFAQVSNQDIMLGHCYDHEILVYNMEEKRFTSVIVEGFPEIDAKVYGTYVESLESLEHFYLDNTSFC
ncbi:F-box/kelch-repeat protein At3g06240-like [Rutidosis leptorrhynchoides]|uniref:F-box/kelch-repeat protein At3g06240-like n=1 Tax=Rutidosis leptorrhynchoides TaxID=125765 RepID=UPI003A9910E0